MNPINYPLLGYDPKLLHCAFYFSVNASVANPWADIPKGTPLEDAIQMQDKAIEKINASFPAVESIRGDFTDEERKQYARFTGLKDKIHYGGGKNRVVITHQSAPYAPQFCLNAEYGTLTSELHNCAAPQLALIMWPHALRALKQIYEAYGIDASWMPDMRFNREGLVMTSPFVLPEKYETNERFRAELDNYLKKHRRPYTLFPIAEPFGRITLENLTLETTFDPQTRKGTFTSAIPLKRRRTQQETNVMLAPHIFEIAVAQSRRLYQLASANQLI